MSQLAICRAWPFAGASALACLLACSSDNLGARAAPPEGDDAGISLPPPDAGPAGYTRIDDMEGTSGRIEWTPTAPPAGTTSGLWATLTDSAQYDHLEPVPWSTWSYAPVPTPYETFPGLTSTHAARFRTTEPLVNTWGAGMNIVFAPEADEGPGPPEHLGFGPSPVDLTAYKGITFWARADQNQDSATILVQFFDQNTWPGGGACLDGSGGAADCYNGFGATVNLTGTFTQYTIDFATLAQQPGWGFQPVPAVPDLQQTYALVFQVSTPRGAVSLSFDVWIDDLYFVDK
jgi:hypothetical protein